MTDSSEVVIVGGGVAGCAIAYRLARQGVRVTVVERDAVGAHASGFAAGILNPLEGANIPGVLQTLALQGYRSHLALWDELWSETGVDVQGRLVPLVRLAFSQEEEMDLRALKDTLQGHEGFPVGWLSPGEVEEIDPRLSRDARGGLIIGNVGTVDSYLYTLALSRAAERHGARFVRGTATGLQEASGRVEGVRLADGIIPCDRVVVAMGPWAAQAEAWLGLRIPIRPLKGEILRLQAPGAGPRHIIHHLGHYVAWKSDGLVWAGTTEEEAGFDDRPSEAALGSIMDGIRKIMPCLADARIIRHTACLRPEASDSLPLIGPAPGREGLYLAAGGGHKGILISPAMAQAVADLVIAGETQLPILDLLPGRPAP